MGISFNVAFKKTVAPYGKLGGDHMALGAAGERLDKLPVARGVSTLRQFISIDPEEVANLSGLDPEELGLPPVQWFDTEVGLAAVRALPLSFGTTRRRSPRELRYSRTWSKSSWNWPARNGAK